MTSNVRPSPRVRAQWRIWQAGAIETTCPHVSLQPRLPAAPTALPPLFTAWAASLGSWERGVGLGGAGAWSCCPVWPVPKPLTPSLRDARGISSCRSPPSPCPHPPHPHYTLRTHRDLDSVGIYYVPATGLSVFTPFHFISTIIPRIRSLANGMHGIDAVPAHRGAVSWE